MIKKLIVSLLFIFSCLVHAQENAQPLTVVLDWFVNPDHAPLIVAEQQGFFQQEGLTVKLVQPADPADGPKLVAAKKAQVAITYQPELLMQIDQGLPLIRFGSLVDSPLDCLVTLKSKNINHIEELKNKTIGYSSGGVDSALLSTMLSSRGLTLNDVKFINVRYDLVQALLSNNIDGFTGAMRNVEPLQLSLSGHPAQVFYPEQYGFPPYEELIFVTHRDLKDDPRLTKFLSAEQKAVAYLVAHPQASWEAAIKRYPELNNAVNKASWFASVKYFSQNPFILDPAKYNTFAQFMVKQKLIKGVPELSSYAIELPAH
jgi:putative hydroxymethylpyrimidine transport system substrate-binding protein